MAYLLIEVEKIEEAGTNPTEHKELEGVIFRADDGKERVFKIKGMLPQSTSYMRKIIHDVDWDETNPHVAIVLGEEIKMWGKIEVFIY